jgi:Flp pilus assembly pilin Flp
MTVSYHKRAGQNTVEYLLMLAVIVGVVLVAGMAIKRYMPTLFDQVSVQITRAVGSLGRGAGNMD